MLLGIHLPTQWSDAPCRVSHILVIHPCKKVLPPRSVGVPVAATEVRFKDISIASTVAVGARSLPSLTNDIINMLQVSSRRAPAGLALIL